MDSFLAAAEKKRQRPYLPTLRITFADGKLITPEYVQSTLMDDKIPHVITAAVGDLQATTPLDKRATHAYLHRRDDLIGNPDCDRTRAILTSITVSEDAIEGSAFTAMFPDGTRNFSTGVPSDADIYPLMTTDGPASISFLQCMLAPGMRARIRINDTECTAKVTSTLCIGNTKGPETEMWALTAVRHGHDRGEVQFTSGDRTRWFSVESIQSLRMNPGARTPLTHEELKFLPQKMADGYPYVGYSYQGNPMQRGKCVATDGNMLIVVMENRSVGTYDLDTGLSLMGSPTLYPWTAADGKEEARQKQLRELESLLERVQRPAEKISDLSLEEAKHVVTHLTKVCKSLGL